MPLEVLSNEEMNRLWPGLSFPEGFVGCLETTSGILYSERCIQAFRHLGVANGMTLLPYTRVKNIEMSSNGAAIQTAHHSYYADFVLVSAGAWSGKMLNRLGIEFTASAYPENSVLDKM